MPSTHDALVRLTCPLKVTQRIMYSRSISSRGCASQAFIHSVYMLSVLKGGGPTLFTRTRFSS